MGKVGDWPPHPGPLLTQGEGWNDLFGFSLRAVCFAFFAVNVFLVNLRALYASEVKVLPLPRTLRLCASAVKCGFE